MIEHNHSGTSCNACLMHKWIKLENERDVWKNRVAERDKEAAALRSENKKIAQATRDNYDSLTMKKERIKSLEARLKPALKLVAAVEALSHPDGEIRAPLLDGPELVELNEAIADCREATV